MPREKTDPEELLRRDRERCRKDREWYKSRGYCTQCQTEKAVPGETRCLVCKMKQREAYQKEKQNEKWYKKTLEANKERLKTLRERRKAQGLCPACGKRKLENGAGQCDYCRARSREYARRSRERKREPKAWWECKYCHNMAVPGKKLCEKHREQYLEYCKKASEVAAKSKEKNPYRKGTYLFWEEMKYHARRKADQEQRTG